MKYFKNSIIIYIGIFIILLCTVLFSLDFKSLSKHNYNLLSLHFYEIINFENLISSLSAISTFFAVLVTIFHDKIKKTLSIINIDKYISNDNLLIQLSLYRRESYITNKMENFVEMQFYNYCYVNFLLNTNNEIISLQDFHINLTEINKVNQNNNIEFQFKDKSTKTTLYYSDFAKLLNYSLSLTILDIHTINKIKNNYESNIKISFKEINIYFDNLSNIFFKFTSMDFSDLYNVNNTEKLMNKSFTVLLNSIAHKEFINFDFNFNPYVVPQIMEKCNKLENDINNFTIKFLNNQLNFNDFFTTNLITTQYQFQLYNLYIAFHNNRYPDFNEFIKIYFESFQNIFGYYIKNEFKDIITKSYQVKILDN